MLASWEAGWAWQRVGRGSPVARGLGPTGGGLSPTARGLSATAQGCPPLSGSTGMMPGMP